jgi:hypothetical protein
VGSSGELKCRVQPFKPSLNYSFRFQTGYVLELPLALYTGKGHSVITLVRVTPENSEREPAYLWSRAYFGDVPPTKQVAQISGGYVVGEGKYRVELLVSDDSGRTCKKDWNITAKLSRKEDDVPPGMAAGAVDEISLRKWMRSSRTPGDDDGYRVTVLMDVSPMMPRRVRLGSYDRVMLLSSLTSLLERLPLRSVRLVLFNLEQQREIYRDENFEPSRFGRVAQALTTLELGTVAYDVIKNRTGHIDLLADMMEDARKVDQSDAVVFLGPKPWHFDKVPKSALPERSATDPTFFYLQLRPYIASASAGDPISSAVKYMGGKTFDVYTPGDFAAAIRDVTKALESKRLAARPLTNF